MIPIEKVKLLLIKHQDIEKELSSGKLDAVNFKNKSKEYSELNEIVPYARKYLNFEKIDLKKSKKHMLKICWPRSPHY